MKMNSKQCNDLGIKKRNMVVKNVYYYISLFLVFLLTFGAELINQSQISIAIFDAIVLGIYIYIYVMRLLKKMLS